jgi:hypothetical protein
MKRKEQKRIENRRERTRSAKVRAGGFQPKPLSVIRYVGVFRIIRVVFESIYRVCGLIG